MVFELITIIFQTIWLTLNGMLTAVWNCLPDIIQLNKLLGYFTPAGIVGLYLGVPTVVTTIAVFLFKKAVSTR